MSNLSDKLKLIRKRLPVDEQLLPNGTGIQGFFEDEYDEEGNLIEEEEEKEAKKAKDA